MFTRIYNKVGKLSCMLSTIALHGLWLLQYSASSVDFYRSQVGAFQREIL